MTFDFTELARVYWASPPYDRSWDADEEHPFDTIVELLDSDDATLSALLLALALAAPLERLPSLGTSWVESLEYRFEREGAVGKSITVLLATGLDADALFRILSGVYPDWLARMDAAELLNGRLSSAQIAWLVDPTADGRSDSL